ncbi:LysR family transcriptional regulator [Sutterella sp.]|uniref:LysR family transcriptional regulator n=1 Tax=Sutterella sp. TaxID=1981025 RepID=UPI0026DF1E96|nr:LysR family transcriptional regulator [Sutterella sp.]MDO5530798.1 LysR family transcriptional regulator [Sutterella sp.]
MFDTKHLQAFATLAEHMHFGRAAQALGLSQSTLSAQIRALEEEVGGPLINRSNRTFSLTPVGEVFLQDCQGILSMMLRARRNTDNVLGGTVATLRIGVCSAVISSGIFNEVLGESRRRFPALELIAEENPPATLAKKLSEGRLDLMLGVTYGVNFSVPVFSMPLAAFRAAVVAPAGLDIAARDDAGAEVPDMARIAEHPFVLYENAGCESPPVVDTMLAFHPRKVIRVASVRLMMSYVRDGGCIAMVPEADLWMMPEGTRSLFVPDTYMEAQAVRLATSNSPILLKFFRMLDEMYVRRRVLRP